MRTDVYDARFTSKGTLNGLHSSSSKLAFSVSHRIYGHFVKSPGNKEHHFLSSVFVFFNRKLLYFFYIDKIYIMSHVWFLSRISIYIYIYIYIYRERERDRQTDRQTETEKYIDR